MSVSDQDVVKLHELAKAPAPGARTLAIEGSAS